MHGFVFCISSEKECDYDFTTALGNAVGNGIGYYRQVEPTEFDEAITGWIIKPADGVLEYEGHGVIKVAKDPSTLAWKWTDSIRRQAKQITRWSICDFSTTSLLKQALCHPFGDDTRCGVDQSCMFMLEVINAPVGYRFYVHEIYNFHF